MSAGLVTPPLRARSVTALGATMIREATRAVTSAREQAAAGAWAMWSTAAVWVTYGVPDGAEDRVSGGHTISVPRYRQLRVRSHRLAPGVELVADGLVPFHVRAGTGWTFTASGVPTVEALPDWLVAAFGGQPARGAVIPTVADTTRPVSAAPEAVDALLAALRAAPGQVAVQVLDGPFVTNAEPSQLAVGADTGEGPTVVLGELGDDGLGQRREVLTVECLASAWHGDTEMKPVRDRVCAMAIAVGDVLRADPTLGGTVTRARLGASTALAQNQTREGAWALLAFTVRAEGLA